MKKGIVHSLIDLAFIFAEKKFLIKKSIFFKIFK